MLHTECLRCIRCQKVFQPADMTFDSNVKVINYYLSIWLVTSTLLNMRRSYSGLDCIWRVNSNNGFGLLV